MFGRVLAFKPWGLMGPFGPDSPRPGAPFLGGEPEIGYILCGTVCVEEGREGDGDRRERLFVCESRLRSGEYRWERSSEMVCCAGCDGSP